jgi:hypothetical protein
MTIIQVDLPVEHRVAEGEPAEIALAMRIHVGTEAVIVADGAQQLRPGLKVAEQADVADQALNADGHDHAVMAWLGE